MLPSAERLHDHHQELAAMLGLTVAAARALMDHSFRAKLAPTPRENFVGDPGQRALERAQGFDALTDMAVLGAPDPRAIAVARQLHGIFVVDDLNAVWQRLPGTNEALVEPEAVPTGRRFVIRHSQGDGRVIEYLQLRSS